MLAKALRLGGYQVALLPEVSHGHEEDRGPDGIHYFDGFPYFPVESQAGTYGKFIYRVQRALGFYNPSLDWMRELTGMGVNLHAVISAALPALCINSLNQHLRKKSIPMIFDATESFARSSFPYWPVNPNFWDFELRHHWSVRRLGHALAISRVLEEFYGRNGGRTFRVPVLMDPEAAVAPRSDKSGSPSRDLVVAYVGFPGRQKDNIWAVIRGLKLARDEGCRVHLRIVGPTADQLLLSQGASAELLKELAGNITLVGSLPAPAARGEMAKADFTVLVRPDKHYARAGFSTKVVESLGVGTPVIVSPVGDIQLYLSDGQDAIFVPQVTPQAVKAALVRAKGLSEHQRVAMVQAARDCAVRNFSYRTYGATLPAFVRESRSRLAGAV